MQKQSNYKVIKWEEERLEKEKLVENISEFPMNLYAGYKDHSRLPTAEIGYRKRENLPNIKGSVGPISRKASRRRKLNTQQDFYRAKETLTGMNQDGTDQDEAKEQQLREDIGGQINLPPERRILTQKARKMNGGYYLIEVSRTDDVFYITAMKKRNRNENYLIELEWSKSKEILAQFHIKGGAKDLDSDYERLVNSLGISEGQLVLVNPKYNINKVLKRKRVVNRGSQSQQRMRFRKTNGSPYK